MILVKSSQNGKIGVMSATYGPVGESCPSSCGLLNNGCYAQFGNVNIAQRRASIEDRIQKVTEFIKLKIPLTIRHHVSGDFALNGKLDANYLQAVSDAHRGHRPGYSYTHCASDLLAGAVSPVQVNHKTFTLNASADSWDDVLQLKALGWPVVCLVPEDSPRSFKRDGHQVTVCPAQTTDDVTCASCGLCMMSGRKTIVGFMSHGMGKKKAQSIEV